jgi:hypothetical protein
VIKCLQTPRFENWSDNGVFAGIVLEGHGFSRAARVQ